MSLLASGHCYDNILLPAPQTPQMAYKVEALSPSSRQLSGLERWQLNVPDYQGADAYRNIQAKIDAHLMTDATEAACFT